MSTIADSASVSVMFGMANEGTIEMSLNQFLRASSATPDFRAAVAAFAESGRPNDRISFPTPAPPIKVERTLTMVLASYPKLPIERVEINGSSGCSHFRGTALVYTEHEAHSVEFDWDCRWKAIQLGWTDYFGFPDQTRAAREFGYACFKRWEPIAAQ